jgi:rubrerythrin
MGSKSIAARATSRRQRQKMNMSKYTGSKLMVRPENMGLGAVVEIKPPTREVVACESCGFNARYQFGRCPSCGALRST